jgi:hypothetical protein
MLRNHIAIGLEVSQVGDCKQLGESFWKISETDKPHTFQKRLDDAIKGLSGFFWKETL